MRRGTGRMAAAILVLAGLVGSCSAGDDDAGGDSTVASPGPSESTTTSSSDGDAGTGDEDPSDATTSTTTPADGSTPTSSAPDPSATSTTVLGPTTTLPDGPTYPLTGLPMDDELKGHRAALVVKMDNHPQARPQSGLNSADIVFEENVENLTRFAAVFQSGDADPVGPVRSGRTQDIDLLGSLNRPLFAWSGGNPTVTRAIRSSDLVDVSWTVAGEQGGYRRIRSPGIDTEHTLYASTYLLFENFVPIYAPPPPAQFTYREPGEAFNGEAAAGADVEMDGVAVTWLWDADETHYVREQNGQPHNVNEGGQVNAANVVVLEVEYRRSAADTRSPEAVTVGYGPAWVLTAGVLVQGTWERADRLEPFTLRDLDGNVVALTPGRTWVELARRDTVDPLPA